MVNLKEGRRSGLRKRLGELSCMCWRQRWLYGADERFVHSLRPTIEDLNAQVIQLRIDLAEATNERRALQGVEQAVRKPLNLLYCVVEHLAFCTPSSLRRP